MCHSLNTLGLLPHSPEMFVISNAHGSALSKNFPLPMVVSFPPSLAFHCVPCAAIPCMYMLWFKAVSPGSHVLHASNLPTALPALLESQLIAAMRHLERQVHRRVARIYLAWIPFRIRIQFLARCGAACSHHSVRIVTDDESDPVGIPVLCIAGVGLEIRRAQHHVRA